MDTVRQLMIALQKDTIPQFIQPDKKNTQSFLNTEKEKQLPRKQ